ncbi:MAG: hypothetical protein WAV30_01460 [Microgenomates group bacterium]
MKKQIQLPLLIISIVLFFVLVAELLFLFVYKKNQQDSEKKINETSAATINGLAGLYKPASDEDAKVIFGSINVYMDTIKPLYKTGVLKELLITETYKSVVTKIGKIDVARKDSNGKMYKFVYEIHISNLENKEMKERSYLLGQEEIEKIEVYQAMGNEEVEIALADIKAGDFVSITSTINFFTNPENNLDAMKIVKLL